MQESDFSRALKPKGFDAYHYAVMLCLMVENSQTIFMSQPTIAARTGMSDSSVKRVLIDLKKWKWLHAYSGKRQYNTNSVQIMYANLPQSEPIVPLNITKNAEQLAEFFFNVWRERCSKYKNKYKQNCTRPIRKDWRKRWFPTFQRLLNEGYGYQELGDIIKNADAKLLLAGPQSRQLFPMKGKQ
jgi:hypothetical protein